MVICWIAHSFSFNLLNFFIKYMPGDIFINSIAFGLSSLGMLIEGPIAKRINCKVGLGISFTIALISSVIINLFSPNTEYILLYSLILLIARTGILMEYGFICVLHTELFPTHYLVTSFGICNLFCRSFNLVAPIVAESSNHSIPLTLLVILAAAGFGASFLLRRSETTS